jgi:hypothetical protein
MKLNLCRHIRTNGLQCQGVALAGSPFCYFHDRLHRRHVPYRFSTADAEYALIPGQHIQLGPLEDSESVQIALSQVINALATGRLDMKRATSLLYGLQIAAANAARIHIAPRPLAAVRDTGATAQGSATPGVDLARPGVVYEVDDEPESLDPGDESFIGLHLHEVQDHTEEDEFNRLAEERHNQEEPPLAIHTLSAAASSVCYRNFGGKSRTRAARRAQLRAAAFALTPPPLYNQPNPRQPSLSPNLRSAGHSKYDHHTHR